MKTITIHIPANEVKSYELRNHDQFVTRVFEVKTETDMAVMLSRYIEKKAKEYTCWIPKKAFEWFHSGDTMKDETNAFIKNFIYNDSYKNWFLTA